MYTQMNDQIASNTRQYADTAAQINRIALQNAERVFALNVETLQSNTNAAFAYFTKLLEVRDLNDLREVVPAGVQVARENIERAVAAGQEAYAGTLKSNESIGQLAKGQFEQVKGQVEKAANTVKAEAEKAVKNASKA
ncbi:phasin family protein [Lysobacter sp. HDW10]|jgi:hypothetical protein|uniref:phasin family protein n=1 Tax=Lysobacter sp. HDW10 TaxID=2714936 RepID=UPI001408E7B8|nr:phasin family protein [Lysobacter sp. HDW10]QIK80579.1 phasin family protein [Lysobacter sp. HDW10]